MNGEIFLFVIVFGIKNLHLNCLCMSIYRLRAFLSMSDRSDISTDKYI